MPAGMSAASWAKIYLFQGDFSLGKGHLAPCKWHNAWGITFSCS